MLRKLVVPVLWTAVTAVAASGLAACHAEASFGGQQPQNPPPPPPAPPATAAATPPPAPTTPPPAPTTPPAPPKQDVTLKDGKLGLPGAIVYETGKAIIKPESEPTLNALKAYMDQNKTFTRIRIEGHTDNVGKSADNLKLSVDRSLAVEDWLVQHGIPRERLLAVGFGDSRPIADNASDDGKAQNRRTEFHVAEIVGRPFGGRDETGGGTVAPNQTPYPQAKK